MISRANPWLFSSRWLLLTMMLPAAALIGALLYFTIWAFAFSFTDLALLGVKSIKWSWIGFQNYQRLITREGFLGALWTTVLFTFFSALVGQSTLGFLFATALRGSRSKLKSTVEVALMLGWLLPDIVAALLWSATTSDTGLINRVAVMPFGFKGINFINDYALTVVIVANIWKGTAWSYLLFSAALDSIPREVIEATKVDGATAWQRVTRVVLPMIRPHIATNMLFITIWTFTAFPLIFAMTGGGPGDNTSVLAIFMYQQSFMLGKLGYGAAISVAMLLIVGTLSIFYLRMLKEPK
jgi:multiple sugar transport system permease protein